MYQKSEKADVYQIITDRIIDMLEKGTVPWQKPWTSGPMAMPKNLVSNKMYNGINIFLLATQGFDSPYWLTFKQAQERGGHVKKGEKGSPCIFWKIYEKEDENAENGVKKLPCLRYYTVFNADQCEGIDAPKIDIVTYPENEKIEKAENIQLYMQNRPTITYGGSSAYYNMTSDLVNVPKLERFEKPAEYYSALFHELAHSTGHQSRLNRDMSGCFGSNPYAKEELIAEMTAAFLCSHCGIEVTTLENSAAYIQGWLKALRNDKKLVINAAAAAQKAANYILNIKEN